ncbi:MULTISPECIES: hypothetical protein [unclassified Afipia]|uniref:hypothetical protein n=1 Tax=unclassified Afipia TaxID=2642050 RepID=UPI0012DFE90C|nr:MULTISPECIES: hypothetical protein [unclassified Afipia]
MADELFPNIFAISFLSSATQLSNRGGVAAVARGVSSHHFMKEISSRPAFETKPRRKYKRHTERDK